jgi:choline dehydrogenase-like flavoprotein
MTPRAGRSDHGLVTEHYGVIIVGTGAGGGTLAHTLAPSGERIPLLERGHFLPRELDNWDPKPVFVDGKYISKDTWFDRDGTSFFPSVGAVNPALTAMANAIRVGEHLLSRMS